MKPSHIALSTLLAASMTLTGCIDQTKDVPNQVYIYSDDGGTTPTEPPVSPYPLLPKEILPSNITTDTTLTSNIVWVIDGLTVVESGATLTIEPGTILVGKDGTGVNTSFMVVDKGAQIFANGTETDPIIFTSELEYDGTPAAVGQWGGLTIIGNAANDQVAAYEINTPREFTPGQTDLADNSGVLNHVKILNSGITMDVDKEINGLSLVGVGSGTTIENISVIKSDDDCIELWGGTVNLTNVRVRECTDDQFDIDDGYAGTVTNLDIHQTAINSGNAAIEMSGTTSATFDGFTITQDGSSKEGGIYFKNGLKIGGHFKNGIVRDNVTDGNGAIHSNNSDVGDSTAISFENVTLTGTSTDPRFTGEAAAAIETIFNAGTLTRAKEETLPSTIEINTDLTADTIYVIDGLTVVESGATLTIEPGTILVGKDGTGINTSFMVVDRGAQIIANGTDTAPIIFTSENAYVKGDAPAVGQWGGLTIIGNAANDQVAAYEINTPREFTPGQTDLADNSGVLNYVQILNSGITMDIDKEINGLSLVGVGSGTTIENISVIKSDDDCIELWGGTVDLTNITVRECTDDQFDIDDGYAGTVTNLDIYQTTTNPGNAAIEMSGTTAATFDGFTIVQNASSKEGGIYFKNGLGIGGHFLNGTVIDNVIDANGAIHSNNSDVGDSTVISFDNVTLTGLDSDDRFTGEAGDTIEAIFDAGTGNSK